MREPWIDEIEGAALQPLFEQVLTIRQPPFSEEVAHIASRHTQSRSHIGTRNIWMRQVIVNEFLRLLKLNCPV
jgi:hypothetical protein